MRITYVGSKAWKSYGGGRSMEISWNDRESERVERSIDQLQIEYPNRVFSFFGEGETCWCFLMVDNRDEFNWIARDLRSIYKDNK